MMIHCGRLIRRERQQQQQQHDGGGSGGRGGSMRNRQMLLSIIVSCCCLMMMSRTGDYYVVWIGITSSVVVVQSFVVQPNAHHQPRNTGHCPLFENNDCSWISQQLPSSHLPHSFTTRTRTTTLRRPPNLKIKSRVVLFGVRSELRQRISTSAQRLFRRLRRKNEPSETTLPSSRPPLDDESVQTKNQVSISEGTNNNIATASPTLVDTRVLLMTNTQQQPFVNRNDNDDDVVMQSTPNEVQLREVESEQPLLATTMTTTALLETITSIPMAATVPTETVVSPPEIQTTTVSRRRGGIRLHLDEIPLHNSTTTMRSLTRAKNAASLSSQRKQLYILPKNTRNLTKLENEFRSMMEHFANYSEADLLSIADPRKRVLFEGIASSSYSRPVYRAFEVLFEDLLPLRYAGRVIYGKLREFMIASVQQRQVEMDMILEATGCTRSNTTTDDDVQRISEIRLMFVSTASQLNSDSYLTLNQLSELGILSTTATEVLGFDTVDDVLQRLDKLSTGRITFVDLLLGLWELASDYCGLEMCNPQVVLHNILVELNEYPPPPTDLNARMDSNRQRYGHRYDEMVSSFIQWKHLLPPLPPAPTFTTADGEQESPPQQHVPVESRRMEIVRGCFAGAELPKVVDALRVVYVDYSALRVAGDIIFKLTSTILNKRR